MPDANLGRRAFAAALMAAGAAAPGLASAAILDMVREMSRIPATDHDYAPPGDLKTIADIYKRMTASVGVNGAGPFQFVVDTGANQSVIATEVASQLGLPTGDTQPLNGVAGAQMTATTRANLQIGARRPTSTLLSILPTSAIGGQGILGLDQLDGGRLTLDFRRQTLSIDAGDDLPGSGDEFSLQAHRRDGQLTLVDTELAGIHVTAFLDSGAQDTIGNMTLRDLAITRYPTSRWSQAPIVSVTGQTMIAEMADLPSLRIGSLHLPNWPMAFADLHTFQMWNLVDRPAILIGVDILSRFETVCLDFARNEVRLRLPQRS